MDFPFKEAALFQASYSSPLPGCPPMYHAFMSLYVISRFFKFQMQVIVYHTGTQMVHDHTTSFHATLWMCPYLNHNRPQTKFSINQSHKQSHQQTSLLNNMTTVKSPLISQLLKKGCAALIEPASLMRPLKDQTAEPALDRSYMITARYFVASPARPTAST